MTASADAMPAEVVRDAVRTEAETAIPLPLCSLQRPRRRAVGDLSPAWTCANDHRRISLQFEP